MSRNYKQNPKNKDSKSSYKGKKSVKQSKSGKGTGNDVIDKTGLDNSGRDNDPNDYFDNAELAEQASQLSFQNMLGLGAFNGYEIPTICKVEFNPCPGISYEITESARYDAWKEDPAAITPHVEFTNVKSGLNMMAVKTYTLLSTFSGRTSNYGPQDVGIMICAIASIAELSEDIRRQFGVALTYNPRNRTMPVELLSTMGESDPTNLMRNMADNRMRFNMEISRINQIPLLDNISFIRKSRNMYQKIYQDDPSSMAQLFYWAPHSVWMIDESSSSSGSILVEVDVYNQNTVAKLKILGDMITALLESTTLNLIYADLLNLANKIKVPTWQFDYLAENYVVKPEYNATASLQFHNLNVVGDPAELGSDDISGKVPAGFADIYFTRNNNVYTDTDTNALVYNPCFPNLYKSRPRTIVDMYTDTPTMEDRIEALRMSCIPSGWYINASDVQQTSEAVYGIVPTLADHYVVRLVLYRNKYNSGSQVINRIAYNADRDSEYLFNNIQSMLNVFNDAPMIEYYDTYANGMDTKYMTGDVRFYTEVDYEYLRRVNTLMYVGLFNFRV